MFLVGFMASGKTTVGRALARRLGTRFVDTDTLVEARAGATVSEIFARDGEPRFRALERAALVSLGGEPAAVVGTGGGILIDPANRDWMAAHGEILWLDAPFAQVWERCAGDAARPLVASRDETERLYESRRALYARAGHRIETAGRTVDEVVAACVAALDRARESGR